MSRDFSTEAPREAASISSRPPRCTPGEESPCTARSAATPTPASSTPARPTTAPAIRRRRQCPECGRRFTTLESASLSVVKRSGATEPFSRAKVLVGVRKACQGRPVSEDQLALLAQRVEETIRQQGSAEVEAHEVGLAVLEPLRELDEVAYLRFASVYQAFDTLEDFETAITLLRAERDATGREPAAQAPTAD